MQHVTIKDTRLLLHPFRAACWEEEATLLIADLHLGKARHFRRAGIAVPLGVADADWDRLLSLLHDFRPRRVLFLGDLFHSDYNREWEEFRELLRQFNHVRFELVRGNHDILTDRQYQRAGLEVHAEPLEAGPFLFSHHPLEDAPAGRYNLAGHVHPGVWLHGGGRQRRRLPCFWFGSDRGLLPAFSVFAGMAAIRPAAADRVFVIADDEVIEV